MKDYCRTKPRTVSPNIKDEAVLKREATEFVFCQWMGFHMKEKTHLLWFLQRVGLVPSKSSWVFLGLFLGEQVQLRFHFTLGNNRKKIIDAVCIVSWGTTGRNYYTLCALYHGKQQEEILRCCVHCVND